VAGHAGVVVGFLVFTVLVVVVRGVRGVAEAAVPAGRVGQLWWRPHTHARHRRHSLGPLFRRDHVARRPLLLLPRQRGNHLEVDRVIVVHWHPGLDLFLNAQVAGRHHRVEGEEEVGDAPVVTVVAGGPIAAVGHAVVRVDDSEAGVLLLAGEGAGRARCRV